MKSLEDAVELVRMLERLTPGEVHVALHGSTLHRGEGKDIDVIVVPHNTGTAVGEVMEIIEDTMGTIGGVRIKTVEEMHEGWRRKGSTDEKMVESWTLKDTKVDVFYLR